MYKLKTLLGKWWKIQSDKLCFSIFLISRKKYTIIFTTYIIFRSSLCKKQKSVAVFNHGLSHDENKFMCGKLGGKLPTFGNTSLTRKKEYEELKDLFLNEVTNTTCLVSEDINTDRDVSLSTSINVENENTIGN